MSQLNATNSGTWVFWKDIKDSIKFEQNGLWGLKLPDGKIVLDAEYDHIEFCTDFVYVHYGNRHKYFYKNGGTSDCIDEDDDYRFYENGKIGLRNSDGTIFFPAIYDEIYDWGKDCDVVYVRTGNEYHYYNHNHEEILTEVEHIDEDHAPTCPYSLAEEQHTHVLVCAEPIKKKETNRDCFAFNQWVRLSRIPYSKVGAILSECDLLPIPQDAIDHFYDKYTYIYSARVCSAKGKMPLTKCIKKFKPMECYDATWWFLTKISINEHTTINPHDLYNIIKHFENIEYNCADYHIGIAHDNSLKYGEVRVLQVHYFWDDGGAFLEDEFTQEVLPNGTLENIKAALDKFSPTERQKRIDTALQWIDFTGERDWEETERVLNWLKEQGAKDITKFLYNSAAINYIGLDNITQKQWLIKGNCVEWAIKNGGQINYIHDGLTAYDRIIRNLHIAARIKYHFRDWEYTSKASQLLADFLKSHGALTAAEQRKKIESQLDGLTPQEVMQLVATI